jgi:hypothetical protein
MPPFCSKIDYNDDQIFNKLVHFINRFERSFIEVRKEFKQKLLIIDIYLWPFLFQRSYILYTTDTHLKNFINIKKLRLIIEH